MKGKLFAMMCRWTLIVLPPLSSQYLSLPFCNSQNRICVGLHNGIVCFFVIFTRVIRPFFMLQIKSCFGVMVVGQTQKHGRGVIPFEFFSHTWVKLSHENERIHILIHTTTYNKYIRPLVYITTYI